METKRIKVFGYAGTFKAVVELPESENTFMLPRADAESVTASQMVDVLRAVQQVYGKRYEVPDSDLAIKLWTDSLREYTGEQIVWGVLRHVERSKVPPSPSELLERCESRRKKQMEIFHGVSVRCAELIGIFEGAYKHYGLPEFTHESLARSIQMFFTLCYELGKSDFELVRFVQGLLIKAERSGSVKELSPLPELLEKIARGEIDYE